MSCCHREIRECTQDIHKLRRTKGCIPGINRVNSEAVSALGHIADLCETAFESSRMEDIRSKLIKLSDAFQDLVAEENRKINVSESRIQSKKRDYQDEDDRHHQDDDD